MLYCTVCIQSNIPVLPTAFGNQEECSITASNSNMVTDHVPPHRKVGYDESNDYPPGTYVIVAWLNEDSCDSYTGYLGEFYQN